MSPPNKIKHKFDISIKAFSLSLSLFLGEKQLGEKAVWFHSREIISTAATDCNHMPTDYPPFKTQHGSIHSIPVTVNQCQPCTWICICDSFEISS